MDAIGIKTDGGTTIAVKQPCIEHGCTHLRWLYCLLASLPSCAVQSQIAFLWAIKTSRGFILELSDRKRTGRQSG